LPRADLDHDVSILITAVDAAGLLSRSLRRAERARGGDRDGRCGRKEIDRDFQPFPAFEANRMRLAFQLRGDESVKQRGIPQPAAVVLLEKVPHYVPTGSLIGIDPDKLRTLVGSAHAALRAGSAVP
jgi:hypothetical protein